MAKHMKQRVRDTAIPHAPPQSLAFSCKNKNTTKKSFNLILCHIYAHLFMHCMIVVAYMRMVCVTRLWSSANLLRFHPVALNCGVMFKGVKKTSVSHKA